VPDSVWDGPAGYAVSDDEDASDYDSDDADVEAGYAEVDTIEADVSDMVEDARADASDEDEDDEDEDDEDEDDGDEDDGAGYAARRKKRRRRKGQSLTLHTTSGKRMRARRTGPKVIEWTVVHRKISGKPVEQRKVTTSSTQTIGKNLSKIVDSFTAEEKLITRPRHFFKHRTAKSVLTSVNQTGSTVRVQVLNLYTGAIKELSHRASSPRKAARIAKRLRSTLSKAKAWKSVAHGDVVRTVLKKRSKKAKKKDRQMSGTHASRVRRRRGGHRGTLPLGQGTTRGMPPPSERVCASLKG
jgi:ribosomal protein L14